MNHRHNIIFDAERLRYPNTGLFHYCLQLGQSLLTLLSDDESSNLILYTVKNKRIYPSGTEYLNFKSYHRYINPLISDVSIWHCNYQLSNYLPKSKKFKKVITVHDLNFLREKEELGQKKYLKRLQRNIDISDEIVCISEFVKNELLSYCNLENKRISVIYNGNNINDKITPLPILREGLDLSKPFIFSIGVVLPKKNFQSLLHLLLYNDLNLIISGMLDSDSYVESIIHLATSLGVQNRVFLTGPVSESEKYYLLQNCHLFCFPSLTEGFGLPLVEAMHFGCNILLSPSTSLPEVGGNVVKYFESFDEDYLQNLSKNIQNWKLSDEERNAVMDRSKLFTWEHAARQYLDVYKRLINE